jgi:hypothetical protein
MPSPASEPSRYSDPLDPFISENPATQIEALYLLRRTTHAAVVHYGEAYWARSQRLLGPLYVPRTIASLPPGRRPAAPAPASGNWYRGRRPEIGIKCRAVRG